MVVLAAGSTYGAGLSSDAIRIISAGQNFVEGRGLIISTGAPLIFCPPYYSILLGIISVLGHSDVFTVGMYLNILVFGAIIFFAGILFDLIKPGKPIVTILCSLVVFSSPSLIKISANVAPDPLFILYIVWFLITAVLYMRNPSPRNFSGLLVSALLAACQRYIGLSVVLAGAVVILWQQRNKPWRALRDVTIFTLLSSLPTLAYIIFHNYLGYGTLTGPRFDPLPLGNIRIAIEKLVHWFIPGSITLMTGIWVWAGIVLILLITGFMIAWKHGRLKLLADSDGLIPAMAFSIVYGAMLIFMVSYKEHRPLLVDRIHIVMLIPLLMLLIKILPTLIPPLPTTRARWLTPLLLVVFSTWLIYPVASTSRYMANSIRNGESSVYNIHNTRSIRESGLSQYLLNNPLPADARLYSNYNETAWFLTRQQVEGVPTVDQAEAWPRISKDTYLIWFELPELDYMPKTMLTLEEISQQVTLLQVYSGDDGSVYQMVLK
jgi:hypothetical protein